MEHKLRENDPIFQEYLRREGFLIRHVGKCHVGADKFIRVFGENDSPWDRWAPPISDDDQYINYLTDFGIKGISFSKKIQGLRQDRKTPGNFYGGWVVNEKGKDFPIEATYSFFLAQKAVKTLKAMLQQRSSGQGLFLELDFFAPHQPFFVPETYAKKRADKLMESVALPDSYVELIKQGFHRPSGEPLIYHMYRMNWGLYNQGTARDYIVTNLLQFEILDKAIGYFLECLDNQGLYEESLIVFCADHGEMNVEKGLIDKGPFGHPKVTQVPLVVKLPGNKKAGEVVEEPVALIDVAPTFLQAAGIKPLNRIDGQSLFPFIDVGNAASRGPIFFEGFWHVFPNPVIAITAKLSDGKYYLYSHNLVSPYDEFYDLDDTTYKNLLQDGSQEHEKLAKEALELLKDILWSDPRWYFYRDTFRIRHPEIVGAIAGDLQKFRPEN